MLKMCEARALGDREGDTHTERGREIHREIEEDTQRERGREIHREREGDTHTQREGDTHTARGRYTWATERGGDTH